MREFQGGERRTPSPSQVLGEDSTEHWAEDVGDAEHRGDDTCVDWS